jgi:hypothetical protein
MIRGSVPVSWWYTDPQHCFIGRPISDRKEAFIYVTAPGRKESPQIQSLWALLRDLTSSPLLRSHFLMHVSRDAEIIMNQIMRPKRVTRGVQDRSSLCQSCGSGIIESGYGSSISCEFGSGSNPDPGFWWPKTEGKNTADIFYIIFWLKIAIYLCPSYRRSLQPSKENIQHFKK